MYNIIIIGLLLSNNGCLCPKVTIIHIPSESSRLSFLSFVILHQGPFDYVYAFHTTVVGRGIAFQVVITFTIISLLVVNEFSGLDRSCMIDILDNILAFLNFRIRNRWKG